MEHDCSTCLWEDQCDWIQDEDCTYVPDDKAIQLLEDDFK